MYCKSLLADLKIYLSKLRDLVQSLTDSSAEEDNDQMIIDCTVATGLDDSLIEIDTGMWLVSSSRKHYV